MTENQSPLFCQETNTTIVGQRGGLSPGGQYLPPGTIMTTIKEPLFNKRDWREILVVAAIVFCLLAVWLAP